MIVDSALGLLAEIGTESERARAWTLEAVDSADRVVRDRLGIRRTPMAELDDGYVALQLDGLCLRAPYLHNGSVPKVRAEDDAMLPGR